MFNLISSVYFQLPSELFAEEYQTELMSKYFKAFDKLRQEGWFIGEMIWNYADFKTAQGNTYLVQSKKCLLQFCLLGITRIDGVNKKGIFTRQRQPKSSAHFLRKRFWSLAHQINNVTLPSDLDEYII